MRAEYLVEEKQILFLRACRVVNFTRSQWYYQSKRDDSEVIAALDKLTTALPKREFDTYYGRIRAQGRKWNRKRILHQYRKINLALRHKRKRRLLARVKEPLI